MSVEVKSNDVDIKGGGGLVEKVESNSQRAQTQLSAEGDWKGGFESEATGGDLNITVSFQGKGDKNVFTN